MCRITTEYVAAQAALTMLGWDLNRAQSGKLMVRVSPIKIKHYAARYRYSDGHLTYRWGRLYNATLTYIDGKLVHAVFDGDEAVRSLLNQEKEGQ